MSHDFELERTVYKILEIEHRLSDLKNKRTEKYAGVDCLLINHNTAII